jgi:phosphomevalonate kinase
VIREFSRWSGAGPGAAFDLVLDSGSLMEPGPGQPTKLGLGSSAALTVALCDALSYYVATQHGRTRAPDLCTLIGIHSALQGRRGSGLDVAASLHGGLIEYRRLPAPQARPADLPSGVAHCFVWTGHQAATGGFLAGVDRWRQNSERQYRAAMGALTELAEAGVRAALSNDAEEFLSMTDSYATALEDLGRASGTDIVSEPHRRLRALAREYDVVYKPCGAGGGDVGVGMSDDAAALAGFQAAVGDDFKPLSLNIDRQGVKTRSES